jgi:hypothetical protein
MDLEELLKKQNNVIMLQEVTHKNVSSISGYSAHLNIGAEGQGTMILVKEYIHITNVRRLLNGRGMAARLHDIHAHIVNVYVPTRAEKNRNANVSTTRN